MKKIGSVIDCMEQRDKELHDNFMEILRSSRDVPLRDMFGMAARRPASRFWVSEERASEMVSIILSGRDPEMIDRMFPKRRQMFLEISRRVKEILDQRPGTTMIDATREVIYAEAPEFYITDKSAKVIIYNIRKRGRKE